MADPFDPGHLMDHVKDADHFVVPRAFAEGGHLMVPQPLMLDGEHAMQIRIGIELIDVMIEPIEFKATKFMVLEVVAAVIIGFVFILLARKMSADDRPRGRMWNLLEAMLVYLRDEVVRPSIGRHDADRFLPFLWTLFFFVLGLNLLGMVPWAGSPTGALAVTGTLAFIVFCTTLVSGIWKLGALGFLIAQVPPMDLPWVTLGKLKLPLLHLVLWPMVFVIEIFGLLIKHTVLAIRLLANMVAGHLVLAVIVSFIAASYSSLAWYGVMPASVLGATALSLLELFVAFLQAYVFVFLSALFIGMAVHPH